MPGTGKRAAAALLSIGLTAGVAAACAPSGRRPDGVAVAVSIQPQAWLVERIAGDLIEVVPLLNPGDSPATYQPTDAQISRVLRAAVYFRIGVPFEDGEWFRAVATGRQVRIVDLREGITLRRIEAGYARAPAGEHDHAGESEPGHEQAAGGHEQAAGGHEHAAGGPDPHIWLSPRLLHVQAATVERALAELLPEEAAAFSANREALDAELDALDAAIRIRLEPVRGAAVFLFHPSWGYFADDYGLRQIPIEIEGKEPSDSELTAFQELARRERVRVIFVQPQITSRTARILAEALGAEVQVLDPLAREVTENLRTVAETLAGALR